MIKEINIEKAPCLDGIPIEILLYDSEIHIRFRLGTRIPLNCVDAI